MNWYQRILIVWVAAFYLVFYLWRFHLEAWWFWPTEILLAISLLVGAMMFIDRCERDGKKDEEEKAKKEVNDEAK